MKNPPKRIKFRGSAYQRIAVDFRFSPVEDLDLVAEWLEPVRSALEEAVWVGRGFHPSENRYSALGIRLKSTSEDDLIEAIISLRPDDYWGKKNGYYIFDWWDE